MVVATNVRPGRVLRVLLAQQSAKGTPVSNFTNAVKLWNAESKFDHVDDQTDPEWWYNYHNSDFTSSRYQIHSLQDAWLSAHATPTLLTNVLQNLYGPLVGSTFSLVGYVNKWLTLAFVEDKTLANTALRLIRLGDVLVYRMEMVVDGTGYVDLRLDYATERADNTTLGNLAALGVTLPAAPMDGADLNVFSGRAVTLWRDPLGANVQVPFERLNLTLDVGGMEVFWDQLGQRERALRNGPLQATLHLTAKPGDETWQATLDANNNVKQTYRLILSDPASGHTYTFTLFNVTFNSDNIGVKDQVYDPLELDGMATQDANGNFLTITLT